MPIAGATVVNQSRKRIWAKTLILASVLPGLLFSPWAAYAAPARAASAAAVPAAAGNVANLGNDSGTALPLLATPGSGIAAGLSPADERVPTTTDEGEALPDGSHRYSLTFRQLGVLYPPELRGVDGSFGVPFSVRSDKVVTAAKLHLVYSYSPALITNLSHLKVVINGVVVATVPLPKEQAGMLLTRDIPIEPRMVADFNQLNVVLVGHYTLQCEDPQHSSLWANLGNNSSLELSVAPLPSATDLAALPLPFFDRRDIRRLQLPFALSANPSAATLEAAGAIASWFGSLAGYRGAVFPVVLGASGSGGALPASGNAVVLATNDERPLGLNLPPIQGPTLAVLPNPNDARGKLLLVMGRDTNELKTAAAALTLGEMSLAGTSAVVSSLKDIVPRQPYDAPKWLPSDRAVHFGELNAQSGLAVSGYNPDLIRVNLQLPPDLFAWRSKGIPLHLIYRFTPRPSVDKSTLNVNVNENFVASLRIPAYAAGGLSLGALTGSVATDGTAARTVDLDIPAYLLPSTSQLQFHYYYDYVKNGACRDVLIDNVRGAIDPNSTIDISSFPHYLRMPDLAAFSNSGFPFTRMADLSQSAVLLPDAPSATDYSTYLTLMGRMGASTGYPVLGVRIGHAVDAKNFADRDLLVIGSPANQSLFQSWANAMPFSANANSSTFGLSNYTFGLLDWWHGEERAFDAPRHAQLSLTAGAADAVLMGFKSPLNNSRSVVALALNTPRNASDLLAALMDADLLKQIQGGLAVVHGHNVSSIALGDTYYVGSLPPLEYLRWVLSSHPVLLAIAAIIVAMILAALAYRVLRGIAARRLDK